MVKFITGSAEALSDVHTISMPPFFEARGTERRHFCVID